jgi:hypothetical protein
MIRLRRARFKDKHVVKPNIYKQDQGIPGADITYSLNGQNNRYIWKQGVPSLNLLSAVSVFDANTASVHVDEENDVAYVPFPLELLSRLSKISQEIQTRLKTEIQYLEEQMPNSLRQPQCSPENEVGKIVNNINSKSQSSHSDQENTD